MNEEEGLEIAQKVNIPFNSDKMNAKNQKVMKFKDMDESER